MREKSIKFSYRYLALVAIKLRQWNKSSSVYFLASSIKSWVHKVFKETLELHTSKSSLCFLSRSLHDPLNNSGCQAFFWKTASRSKLVHNSEKGSLIFFVSVNSSFCGCLSIVRQLKHFCIYTQWTEKTADHTYPPFFLINAVYLLS